MPRDIKILFQKTGGDFIDPTEVGSFIRYKVHVKTNKGETPDKDYVNTDFTMNLGDCNRVISWEFEEYGADDECEFKTEKIDLAIKILQQAKVDMQKADVISRKERARVMAAKEAVKRTK